MEHLNFILISGLLISSISISGIFILKIHRRIALYVERNLLYLSAVSAGVFLVTSSLLIKETLEILPLSRSLVAFGLGILLYLLLHQIFSPHRHMRSDHDHSRHEKKSSWKIIIGHTIHNIADGLLLVASFGAGITIGLSNAFSIALHETPQEISQFMVLRKHGFNNREVIYRNFTSALSIFIGIAIGLFFIQTEILQAYLLGITATFFLGIVFTDLFPIHRLLRNNNFWKMFQALLIGIIFMSVVRYTLGTEHNHKIDHHDDHHVTKEASNSNNH